MYVHLERICASRGQNDKLLRFKPPCAVSIQACYRVKKEVGILRGGLKWGFCLYSNVCSGDESAGQGKSVSEL